MGMGGMPAGGGGPPEGKLTGEIKNWNDEKGFGFVVPQGGGDDVFCHRTDVQGSGERPQLARGPCPILPTRFICTPTGACLCQRGMSDTAQTSLLRCETFLA